MTTCDMPCVVIRVKNTTASVMFTCACLSAFVAASPPKPEPMAATRRRRPVPRKVSGAATMLGSPLGVSDTGQVALPLRAKKSCARFPVPVRASHSRGLARHPYTSHHCSRPSPWRCSRRQHRCRECVASDITSARLASLSGRGHIVSDHNDGHARRNDAASRDSVAGGMAIRLRYDEGEIDVGWSHRCGWRRHQSLLEDRVTRNNVSRLGRSDDWQNGADSPGSDRGSSSEGGTRSERKRSDTSDSERRRPHGLVIPAPRLADHGT
jgi:hypothetical protein